MLIHMSNGSDDLTELGQELEEYLQRLGWSRRRLAEEAGLTIATISRLMRGLQPATHENIEAIAAAFQMDPFYLKRRAGLMAPLPGAERDPTVEYIAQRLEALPPAVREEAVDALGAQLDTIYKVAGLEKEKGAEPHHWRGMSFEEAEAQGKEALVEWARANRRRFMEIVSELGLDVPHSSTDDDTNSGTSPQRRTGT